MAGQVASTKGILMLFVGSLVMGSNGPPINTTGQAIARVQALCIAVLIILLITILWPVSAISQIRDSIMKKSLPGLHKLAQLVFNGYLNPGPPPAPENPAPNDNEANPGSEPAAKEVGDGYHVDKATVIKAEVDLKKLFLTQKTLVDEAATEPRFWRGRYPKQVYTHILTCQKQLLGSIVTIDRALRIGTLEGAYVFTLLFAPFRESLKVVEADIEASMQEIISELQQGSYFGRTVSYTPLRTQITLQHCENVLSDLLKGVITEHIIRSTLHHTEGNKDGDTGGEQTEVNTNNNNSEQSETEDITSDTENDITARTKGKQKEDKYPLPQQQTALILSNVDILAFSALMFGIRQYVNQMHELWEAVCALIQTHQVYHLT
jgi:hypothetical protein